MPSSRLTMSDLFLPLSSRSRARQISFRRSRSRFSKMSRNSDLGSRRTAAWRWSSLRRSSTGKRYSSTISQSSSRKSSVTIFCFVAMLPFQARPWMDSDTLLQVRRFGALVPAPRPTYEGVSIACGRRCSLYREWHYILRRHVALRRGSSMSVQEKGGACGRSCRHRSGRCLIRARSADRLWPPGPRGDDTCDRYPCRSPELRCR
jgi:hypothetical protein